MLYKPFKAIRVFKWFNLSVLKEGYSVDCLLSKTCDYFDFLNDLHKKH